MEAMLSMEESLDSGPLSPPLDSTSTPSTLSQQSNRQNNKKREQQPQSPHPNHSCSPSDDALFLVVGDGDEDDGFGSVLVSDFSNASGAPSTSFSASALNNHNNAHTNPIINNTSIQSGGGGRGGGVTLDRDDGGGEVIIAINSVAVTSSAGNGGRGESSGGGGGSAAKKDRVAEVIDPEMVMLHAMADRAQAQTEALTSFWNDVATRHQRDIPDLHSQRVEETRVAREQLKNQQQAAAAGAVSNSNSISSPRGGGGGSPSSSPRALLPGRNVPIIDTNGIRRMDGMHSNTTANATSTNLMYRKDFSHLLAAQYAYLVDGAHSFQQEGEQPVVAVMMPPVRQSTAMSSLLGSHSESLGGAIGSPIRRGRTPIGGSRMSGGGVIPGSPSASTGGGSPRQQYLTPMQSPGRASSSSPRPRSQTRFVSTPVVKKVQDKSYGSYNLLINELICGITASREENERLKAAVFRGGSYSMDIDSEDYMPTEVCRQPQSNNSPLSSTRRHQQQHQLLSPRLGSAPHTISEGGRTTLGRQAALETANITINKLEQFIYAAGREEQFLEAATSEAEVVTKILQDQANSIRITNLAALALRTAAASADPDRQVGSPPVPSSPPSTTTPVQISRRKVTAGDDGDDGADADVSDTSDNLNEESACLLNLLAGDGITKISSLSSPSRQQLGSFLPAITAGRNRCFSTSLTTPLESSSLQQLDFIQLERDLRNQATVATSTDTTTTTTLPLIVGRGGGGGSPSRNTQHSVSSSSSPSPSQKHIPVTKNKNSSSSAALTDQYVKTMTSVPTIDDIRAFLGHQRHLRDRHKQQQQQQYQ